MKGISLCVRAGAAYLDEREPGWEWHINRDRLDMGSKYNDVLGQLAGTYEEGLRRFGFLSPTGSFVSPLAFQLGFTCFDEQARMQRERLAREQLLTSAWNRQIELRLARHRA